MIFIHECEGFSAYIQQCIDDYIVRVGSVGFVRTGFELVVEVGEKNII